MRARKREPETPEAGKPPEFWEGVIANLNRDKAAGEVERGEIEAERRSLALAATSGDAAAMERVAELNQRRTATDRRLDLLANAVEDAKERLAEALAERQRAAAEAKRAEAVVVAGALVEQSARADRAFAELVAALAARAGLARKLAALGGVSLNHLMNRVRLLAAAMFAGLDGQLEIGRAPRHLCASLRDIDRSLLRDLLPPAEGEAAPEPERAADPRAIAGQMGPPPPLPPVPPAPKHDPSVRW